MNREEATFILGKIALNCEGLNAQTANLVPLNGDEGSSQAYQIQIKPSVTERDFQHIKSVIRRTDLSVVDEPNGNSTVIYGSLNRNMQELGDFGQ